MLASLLCKQGSRAYDFWLSLEGGFSGGFIIFVLANRFYDRYSDPTKPREECDD